METSANDPVADEGRAFTFLRLAGGAGYSSLTLFVYLHY